MMRLLFISVLCLVFVGCKEKFDKPPSSGEGTVLLNQELWDSEVVLTNREPSVGWDGIQLVEYWSNGLMKASIGFPVEFDLILSQSTHPLTSRTVSLPSVELDSIQAIFGYKFPEGDASAAIYKIARPSDLSNEILFELDDNDPKLVTIKWSAEFVLDESWRTTAEAAGHPDTIRMENGTATFRLP